MLEGEPVADYLRSKISQASEVTVENVFRTPGDTSRETWSFDTRWQEGRGILEQLVIGPHAPTGLIDLTQSTGAN
jgi:hypothetical protein